ncbi:PREDICTED: transcriptional regulator STERILE APETALA-like [Ipomoea nil]|uniref:transcriptional regulator STERILE APETALA-like n=1 Tax=Ipomoea nil TaxID=35883 RepID=UPI0009011E68|nr:PREDICTED: transcriptional regulator STERILE APETALA-like [Ipomoea nil]
MSSSSSSTNSSSSPEPVEGREGSAGGVGFEAATSSSSRSRRRGGNGVWPEPFVEALACQVAIDAASNNGRLAAAPALASLFQVCSTWRAVSRSDLLWLNLTARIWDRRRLLRNTWRDEFMFWHQTANNFRRGRYVYRTLHFAPPSDDNNDGLSCRRLALSDHHLAAGFSDGTVRLFYIPTRLHLSTFRPHHRDRLGRYSSAVSGIILTDAQLVFASLDGDIHVVVIGDAAPPRRANLGDVVNDGALVDFTGSERWWVGLYAGVPERAFHIWNSETEELAFVGGTLTDPEAVMGWHLLTELTELVGRVRVTGLETAVACTGMRLIVFDLQNHGVIIGQEDQFQYGLTVGAFDARGDSFLIMDNRGAASVRRAEDLEQRCWFNVGGAAAQGGGVMGCMNGGFAIMFAASRVRVWEIERGDGVYLRSLRERNLDVNAMVADERHVAACSSDATIHLWDFGGR